MAYERASESWAANLQVGSEVIRITSQGGSFGRAIVTGEVCQVMRLTKTIIEVMGHTDSTGSDAYNLGLSRRRAQSVGNHLASEGVASMRIVTEGFGEQYPVASNDTVEGRQLNRRVELRLSPLTAS